jgi:RNA polymerase sigma factor (sigma-70 family)
VTARQERGLNARWQRWARVPFGRQQVSGKRPAARVTTPQQARDEEIEAFFVAHRKAVRRCLIAYGCEEHEADDLVQDTILAVREYWERVRTLERPVAYWFKVAIRQLRRVQGERARRYCTGDHHERLMTLPDPVDAPAVVDRRQALMVLIRELPPRQRHVLWLRLAEGFSVAETAAILDIRPGTVKSQLHDAKKRLEELLRKDGDIWEDLQ